MNAADLRLKLRLSQIEASRPEGSSAIVRMQLVCEAENQYNIDTLLLAAGLPLSCDGTEEDFMRILKWVADHRDQQHN